MYTFAIRATAKCLSSKNGKCVNKLHKVKKRFLQVEEEQAEDGVVRAQLLVLQEQEEDDNINNFVGGSDSTSEIIESEVGSTIERIVDGILTTQEQEQEEQQQEHVEKHKQEQSSPSFLKRRGRSSHEDQWEKATNYIY